MIPKYFYNIYLTTNISSWGQYDCPIFVKRRTGRPGSGAWFAGAHVDGGGGRPGTPAGHLSHTATMDSQPLSLTCTWGKEVMVEKLRLHLVNSEAPRFRGTKDIYIK